MRSPIPWVGGKTKLLWLIHLLAPPRYDRFVDVFGGSATVTINHPKPDGCVEIYNDFNGDLVNLFRCVKERPLALARELNFLPLHSRDDFTALTNFLAHKEPDMPFLPEELAIAEEVFAPEDSAIVKELLLEQSNNLDVRRAAAYFKKIRCSFSGTGGSFGAKPANVRAVIPLIWECSRRLENVVIEHRDFESLIRQYGQEGTFLYCDPPYFRAECYEVAFPPEDHARLHSVLTDSPAFVMVSYNCCAEILALYDDFHIFRTVRPNSMSQQAGSEYEEVVMTNYDPRGWLDRAQQTSLFGPVEPVTEQGSYELIHIPQKK